MRGTGGLVERIRGGAKRVSHGSSRGPVEDDADLEWAGTGSAAGGGVGDGLGGGGADSSSSGPLVGGVDAEQGALSAAERAEHLRVGILGPHRERRRVVYSSPPRPPS